MCFNVSRFMETIDGSRNEGQDLKDKEQAICKFAYRCTNFTCRRIAISLKYV